MENKSCDKGDDAMNIDTRGCCVYNVAIQCWKKTDAYCRSCGWNPVVAQKRKEEYKEHPVDTSVARMELLKLEIERAEKKLEADKDLYSQMTRDEKARRSR